MRAVGVAFVAGLLGVVIGSLSAQAPEEFGAGPGGGGPIFEGEIDLFSYRSVTADGREAPVTVPAGTIVQVHPGWVYLPERRMFISSERAGSLSFRGAGGRNAAAERGDDFGTTPNGARPANPGTFRED